MLKNRLAKLEQSVKQEERKLYLVYSDEDKDRLSIPELNFSGTIENGRLLMEQYPNGMFVIWRSMFMDKNYTDEDWRNLAENIAN